MEKEEIRKKIKEELNNISIDLINKKNYKIYKKIINSSEFQNAKTIFSYISLPEEVDTHPIIKKALDSGKKIYVPKIRDDYQMNIHEIFSLNELEKGQYNIEEPTGDKCEQISFDIIIIPGIAFDLSRNRLGRGKGYFDRFLKKTKGIKIGLCFKEQLLSCIPHEEHDIMMDQVITD